MNKSAMLVLCATVSMSFAVSVLPASAQSRLKTCNDEWNAMKANNTVGDKKYADFRKECLRPHRCGRAGGRTGRAWRDLARRAAACRRTQGNKTD